MKRLFSIGLIVCLGCMAVRAQEKDTLESVNKMMELREVVIKGNLPHTRLKGNAMITRIEGTPLAESGTLGEIIYMWHVAGRFAADSLF